MGLAGHRHRTDLRICIDLLIVIIDYFWLVCMIRDDDEKTTVMKACKLVKKNLSVDQDLVLGLGK